MMRFILLILFFLVSHFQLQSYFFLNMEKESLSNSQLREWEMTERKTFIIAAYLIRKFLATQKDSYVSLKLNFCQLRGQLSDMIKKEYKKNKKDPFVYKTFKKSLISVSMIYYLLIYFSRYISIENEDTFIDQHIEDSFLYTYLLDIIDDLDFHKFDFEEWNFKISPEKDQILNLEYPSMIGFVVLGMVCLKVPKGMDDSLHAQVKKLIHRVFCANAKKSYLEVTIDDL